MYSSQQEWCHTSDHHRKGDVAVKLTARSFWKVTRTKRIIQQHPCGTINQRMSNGEGENQIASFLRIPESCHCITMIHPEEYEHSEIIITMHYSSTSFQDRYSIIQSSLLILLFHDLYEQLIPDQDRRELGSQMNPSTDFVNFVDQFNPFWMLHTTRMTL